MHHKLVRKTHPTPKLVATWATAGSLVFILLTGSGDRYGESVLMTMRSSGTIATASRIAQAFLKVAMPEKLTIVPSSRIRRA